MANHQTYDRGSFPDNRAIMFANNVKGLGRVKGLQVENWTKHQAGFRPLPVGCFRPGAGEDRWPLGRERIRSAQGRKWLALVLAAYQQHGSMPAQQIAPAAQQLAANAMAENADAPIAATALR